MIVVAVSIIVNHMNHNRQAQSSPQVDAIKMVLRPLSRRSFSYVVGGQVRLYKTAFLLLDFSGTAGGVGEV